MKSCLISRRERPLVSGITVKYIRLNRGKGHVSPQDKEKEKLLLSSEMKQGFKRAKVTAKSQRASRFFGLTKANTGGGCPPVL